MSASAFLYKRTGNKAYLNVGLHTLDPILKNYTTNEGILVDKPRGTPLYIAGFECLVDPDPILQLCWLMGAPCLVKFCRK